MLCRFCCGLKLATCRSNQKLEGSIPLLGMLGCVAGGGRDIGGTVNL
jgi:hypothetical protein